MMFVIPLTFIFQVSLIELRMIVIYDKKSLKGNSVFSDAECLASAAMCMPALIPQLEKDMSILELMGKISKINPLADFLCRYGQKIWPNTVSLDQILRAFISNALFLVWWYSLTTGA